MGWGDSRYGSTAEKKGWVVKALTVANTEVWLHLPASGARGLPLVVWAHGGGMTLGGARDMVGLQMLSKAAKSAGGFCWASVEYPLSPEAKFPAAIDRFVAVAEALMGESCAAEHGYNAASVGLAGASAGALVVGHAAPRLAAIGHVPSFVAMYYPMVEATFDEASWKAFGDLPACPASWLEWSWHALLSDAEEFGPAISEARRQESSLLRVEWSRLSGRPVLNVVATYDLLRDQGAELGRVMAAAGVACEEVVVPGSHGVAHVFDKLANQRILAWWASCFK